jgi:uncharacterized membrane protein YdjX (TVP38/TMEM64 family)
MRFEDHIEMKQWFYITLTAVSPCFTTDHTDCISAAFQRFSDYTIYTPCSHLPTLCALVYVMSLSQLYRFGRYTSELENEMKKV